MSPPLAPFVSELLDRFDQSWSQGGSPPEITDFLAGTADLPASQRQELLRELVLIDLDRRWRRDEREHATLVPSDRPFPPRPRLEDYLARFPELGDPADLPQEWIVHEYRVRRRWGDRPDEDEYRKRFPVQGERLLAALRDAAREETAAKAAAPAPETQLTVDQPTAPLGALRTGGTSAAAGDVREESATRMGRYRILGELARGGMGVVYRACDERLGRTVALKMIRAGNLASAAEVERFLVEAQAAGQLDHPGIVPVYEIGEDQGSPYFVMALIEGQSLHDRLRQGSLPPREAAELVRDIAEAIQFAHERGIVHRDLKPHNILLDATGRPKVTDFGMAKRLALDSGLTQSGQILGTPSYMSPEQAAGDVERVGVPADVYSLGAVLYCLLTGRPPFQAASVVETLRQVQELDPPAPRLFDPTMPRDLETICLKCLAKPLTQRYATARELADELGRFLRGEPIRARPVSRLERVTRWCLRNKLATGLLVAAALLVAALSLGLWYRVRLQSTRAELSQLAATQKLTAERLAAERQLKDLHEYYSRLNRVREAVTRGDAGWTWQAEPDLARAAELRASETPRSELASLAAQLVTRPDAREVRHLAEGVEVSTMACSPDGTLLAIGVRKHAARLEVQVYEAATGASRHVFTFSIVAGSLKKLLAFQSAYQDGVRSLAWSPDGRWLAAGSRFGRVLVWDTHEPTAPPVTWEAAEEEVRQLEFTRDGQELWSLDRQLRVWQVQDGWKPRELPSIRVLAFALHPTRPWLVIAGDDWRVFRAERSRLHELAGWSGGLTGGRVALSADGRWLAVENRGEITLLAAENDAILARWRLDKVEGFRGLRFASKDRQLVALCAENEVRRWEVPSGRELGTAAVGNVTDGAFDVAQDGRWLALTTAGRQPYVTLVELREPSPTWTVSLPGKVREYAWSNSAPQLAAVLDSPLLSRDLHQFRLAAWDVAADRLLAERRVWYGRTDIGDTIASVAWQPDGQGVVWSPPLLGLQTLRLGGESSATRFLSYPQEPSPVVVEDRELAQRGETSGSKTSDDARAEDGSAVLLPPAPERRELTLRLRELPLPADHTAWALFAPIRTIEAERIEATSAVWARGPESADAALDRLGHIGAWEGDPTRYDWYLLLQFDRTSAADERAVVRCRPGRPDVPAAQLALDRLLLAPVRRDNPQDHTRGGLVAQLAFSPDGSRLWGLCHERRLIASWDPARGTVAATYDNRGQTITTGAATIHTLTVGADRLIAGCRSGVVLVFEWEADQLRLTGSFPGPGGEITATSFAADRTTALIGTRSGYLQRVRLEDGKPIEEFARHPRAVTAVARSEAGLLATGCEDGTIRLYREPPSGSATLLLTLSPQGGPLQQVRFSHDGRYLAASFHDSAVLRIWDLSQLGQALAAWNLNW